MSTDFTAAIDLGKVEDPNKDDCAPGRGVQATRSVKDKFLIVDCTEDPGEKRLSEMQKRMGILENRLEEVGKHFVRYQEDVAAILVQECVRLTHQMHEQKENLQKKMHDQVQKAVSGVKEEIMSEINMEWAHMRDISSSISSGKCKEDMSTRDTASTASASDDLEAPGELVKLMGEARNDIDVMQSSLSNHMKMTEKRFVALELGEKTKEARDEGDVALSKKLGDGMESPQQSIDQVKDSIIYEGRLSPPSKSSECIAEFDTVLKNLVTAVRTALPVPSPTDESACHGSPRANKREISRSQVCHGSRDSVRSVSLSAARAHSEGASGAFPAPAPSRRCASPVVWPASGAARPGSLHLMPASVRDKSVPGGSLRPPMAKPALGGSFQLPPGSPTHPPVIQSQTSSQLQHRTTLTESSETTTTPQPEAAAAPSTSPQPRLGPTRVTRAANASTVFRPRPLLGTQHCSTDV